jgi:hypothetical protein
VNGEHLWGIDKETSKIVDIKKYKLYESASVKVRLSPQLPAICVAANVADFVSVFLLIL